MDGFDGIDAFDACAKFKVFPEFAAFIAFNKFVGFNVFVAFDVFLVFVVFVVFDATGTALDLLLDLFDWRCTKRFGFVFVDCGNIGVFKLMANSLSLVSKESS